MKRAWLKFVIYTAVMLVGVVMVLFGYAAFDRAARFQQMSEEYLVRKQSFQSWSRLKEMQKEYKGKKYVSLGVVSGGFLLVLVMGTLLVRRKSATRKAGFFVVGVVTLILCYAVVSCAIYHMRRNAILKRDGDRIRAKAERIAAEYLARPDVPK